MCTFIAGKCFALSVSSNAVHKQKRRCREQASSAADFRLQEKIGSNNVLLDVLVIGGGNAALCAALMAREAGASVLLLEASPRAWRGGNSQPTRNLRCMHDEAQDVLLDTYPEEEFWQDLLKVTGGATDE